MREGAEGVKRLLQAIYNNADQQTIKMLAHYLRYEEQQLKEDIESIPAVIVKDKKISN